MKGNAFAPGDVVCICKDVFLDERYAVRASYTLEERDEQGRTWIKPCYMDEYILDRYADTPLPADGSILKVRTVTEVAPEEAPSRYLYEVEDSRGNLVKAKIDEFLLNSADAEYRRQGQNSTKQALFWLAMLASVSISAAKHFVPELLLKPMLILSLALGLAALILMALTSNTLTPCVLCDRDAIQRFHKDWADWQKKKF